ncbi:helix-turn-helix domain-containing protein [Spectribacter acetivorans]|uniref:helix-turn-helix domain-containing protein n=1 Tax=Spectribacter acetivorans TaxID=3075603 RepID=UPI0032C230F2
MHLRRGEPSVIRILFKQLLDQKAFTERRRITMNEVCAETGLSRPTLSRIANTPGYRTNTDTIDTLCRYFECQPGELLTWVDEDADGRNGG